MLKIQRNSKGFTLIELLIVIAIIGILAAIAIPAYTGYTKKSKVGGVVHALGGVKTAAAAYYTEKGRVDSLALATADIAGNLGVTVPSQYISAIT
ncbi:MAG: prepilin-type N-terminal cleavage/methylation domain-containing protein, partial [Syntrophorhabdaceae bacterium]|nr:prepilin-type N-terminal cleavage/methylation domain-containing protein [Syntrophorhabdaceae bacterium]